MFPRLAARAHLPIPAHYTPQAIRDGLPSGTDHSYIRDFIYGTIDGAVTTFAIVAELRRIGAQQIDDVPAGERKKIRQIYEVKGFKGADLERVVEVITSDRERWIDTMLLEEHGVQLDGPNPLRAALATFLAFLIVGSVPLLSFFADAISDDAVASPFWWSVGLTVGAFLSVSYVK
jgi:VIT1/CCC1 family predicted Fe2+/Mn2+ transporter